MNYGDRPPLPDEVVYGARRVSVLAAAAAVVSLPLGIRGHMGAALLSCAVLSAFSLASLVLGLSEDI